MPQQDGTTRRSDTGAGTGEAAERRPDDPVHDRPKNRQVLGDYREAEEELLQAIGILPERLYPYYLLAKLYAEPEFYQADKLRAAASVVLAKKPKVESTAIRKMREEVKKIIGKKVITKGS